MCNCAYAHDLQEVPITSAAILLQTAWWMCIWMCAVHLCNTADVKSMYFVGSIRRLPTAPSAGH